MTYAFVGLLFSCWLFVPAFSTTRVTTDFSTGDQDGGDDDYSGSGSGDFVPLDSTKNTVSSIVPNVVITSTGTTAELHEAPTPTKMMEELNGSSTAKTLVDDPSVHLHHTIASSHQTPTNASIALKVATTSASPELKTTTAHKLVRRPVAHTQTSKDETTLTTTTIPVIDDDLPSESTASVIARDGEGSGMRIPSTSDDFYLVTSDMTSTTLTEDLISSVTDKELADDGKPSEVSGSSANDGVLGAVIGGGIVGLVVAMSLLGLMLYRMKKKDEGSYSLEEPKQSNGGYQKPQRQEEFYA